MGMINDIASAMEKHELESKAYEKQSLAFESGVKDSVGKLYYEMDFDFLTQMAQRMDTNKHKYPPYNWKKQINIDELKQAMFRHVLEVMKGNFDCDGREFGHLEAIANNAMIINYQLKNEKNQESINRLNP